MCSMAYKFKFEFYSSIFFSSVNKTASLSSSRENLLVQNRTIQSNPPPPLPLRPIDLLNESFPVDKKPSKKSPKSQTLGNALSKYLSNSNPLRIRVLQGYCSEDSEVNISTGEVYDFHTKKETMVAMVKASSGLKYNIPHSNSQKIGVIHSHAPDNEQSLDGHIFKSVGNLIDCNPTPKVVCAQQEARSNDGKYLVEENEILIIIHAQKGVFKKSLTVYSMLSRSEKNLPSDCNGYFSTKPSLIRLSLLEIAINVPDPFPVEAVIYSTADNISSPIKHG